MNFMIVMEAAAMAAVSTAPTPAPADAAINAVYQRLAAARAEASIDGMSNAFAPGGLLVDQRPGPVISGAELRARLQPMVERLRTDNVRVETAYRIERRSVMGDIALDAGYMRQSIARAEGEATTRYARFLVTLQRQPDGSWKIIGDASMPAQEAAWSALAPVGGLHFDA